MTDATDKNIRKWLAEYGIQGGEEGIQNARVKESLARVKRAGESNVKRVQEI